MWHYHLIRKITSKKISFKFISGRETELIDKFIEQIKLKAYYIQVLKDNYIKHAEFIISNI